MYPTDWLWRNFGNLEEKKKRRKGDGSIFIALIELISSYNGINSHDTNNT